MARQHLRNLFPDEDEAAILEAIPLAKADAALEHLKDKYSIEVSESGEVAAEKEARLDLHGDFGPLRGVAGKVTRAIYMRQRARLMTYLEEKETVARDAARLLRRSHPDDASKARQAALGFHRSRVRLRATAGSGCYDWATAAPTEAQVRLNASEFMFAVRWCLGVALHLGQHACRLRAVRERADSSTSHTVQGCGNWQSRSSAEVWKSS